jgi:hypothetical protein
MGPGLWVITIPNSQNSQAMLIVDQRGLSPAGGVYIGAIMEALDDSLNAESRRQFYNQLLGILPQASRRVAKYKRAAISSNMSCQQMTRRPSLKRLQCNSFGRMNAFAQRPS